MTAGSIPVIADRASAEAFLDERIGRGVKPGLDRIEGLLAFMGDPQAAYPSIHIAGTNGKTTVSRMVQQILGAHGFSTGGFTSPHLSTVEERFSLHGSPLDSQAFTQAVADIAWFVVGYEEDSGELITYFEEAASESGDGKRTSSWIQQDVMRTISDRNIDITSFPISAAARAC